MNTTTFSVSKSQLLLAIGMLCASVAMLTQNSIAAASHAPAAQVAPLQHVNSTVVTALPPVVVTGKRMSAAEKAKYLQMLRTSATTIV